jgi:hypothetical protein
MCALFLASKMQESFPVKVESFLAMLGGAVTAAAFRHMERSILRTLQWQLHPPTPLAFSRVFLHLLRGVVSLEQIRGLLEIAEFNTELSVCGKNQICRIARCASFFTLFTFSL